MKTNKKQITLTIMLFIAIAATQALATTIVAPGTTQLTGNGTSTNPAQWALDSDYVSPSGTVFDIGRYSGGPGSWNQLTIASNQTFTASSGIYVGRSHTSYNLLDINANAQVNVTGSAYCGEGSIMYYSTNNRIKVSGIGAVLSVTESLDISAGYNATNNYLSLSDGGIAVVDSDKNGTGTFSLYNHWTYGNCWMELDGGSLLLYGDKTADFASGQGILSSIKVWDDVTESLQRVAFYSSTTWNATEYLDLLEVAYISDAAEAALLGVSDDYIGFTVVQNVPEPATLGLLAIGGFLIRRKK